MPAWRAKLASLGKRSAPAVRPIRIAAVSAPQPCLGEQLRAVGLDQREQLALERVDLAGQPAELRDLLARDPDARARGQAPQPSVDAVQLLRVDRACRGLSDCSSSGQSASRCQRSRFWMRVRSATRSLR